MGDCKYIECFNCKYMYDCERTYLGGCTDGEEWSEDEENEEQRVVRKTKQRIFGEQILL